MKQKLAFSTLGCPKLSFDEVLETAKRHGIRHIELRGILENVATNTIPALFPENREQTAQKLRNAGMDICVLGCSATFHKGVDEALFECAYAVEAAKALSVPYIRVFGDRYEDDETFSAIAMGLGKACHMAKNSGVRVLLETHGNITTAEKIQRILEVTPGLGLIWDVAHTHNAGEDEEAFAKAMLPYICHVHFKNVKPDGTLCLASEGRIPLVKTAKVLCDLGYQGLFSLEWEKRWHPELAGIDEALCDYTTLF